MSTLERLSLPDRFPDPGEVRRRAAVAVIAGPHDELLFIRRSEREGDPWSGHMAFPGGGEEATDADLRATAARETWEEVGVDLGAGRFLGALPPLLSPRLLPDKAFGIHPYLWTLPVWPAFSPSEEVASIHPLSLRRIAAGEGRGTFRYKGYGMELDMPCLRLDDTFIWGLTLRILDDLVARLGG